MRPIGLRESLALGGSVQRTHVSLRGDPLEIGPVRSSAGTVQPREYSRMSRIPSIVRPPDCRLPDPISRNTDIAA